MIAEEDMKVLQEMMESDIPEIQDAAIQVESLIDMYENKHTLSESQLLELVDDCLELEFIDSVMQDEDHKQKIHKAFDALVLIVTHCV